MNEKNLALYILRIELEAWDVLHSISLQFKHQGDSDQYPPKKRADNLINDRYSPLGTETQFPLLNE